MVARPARNASSLTRAIDANRRRLLARDAVLLEEVGSLYQGAIDTLNQRLQAAQRLEDIRIAQGENPLSARISQARLDVFTRQIAEEMAKVGTEAAGLTELQRRNEVIAAARDFVDLADEIEVRAGIDPETIARTALGLQAPSPISRLFDGVAADVATQARQALFTGIAAGDNPLKIARALRPLIEGGRWRAETIARTETLRAYRQSMTNRFAAAPEIAGWVWISARSRTTCAMCWAMHGTEHPAGEVMATHPNCRCSQGPLPATGRRSINVPQGTDLFDRLSDSDQLAILGRAKYNAYKAGALKLPQLVGTRRHPDWGAVRYEKSLTSVLGPRAKQFFRGGTPPPPPAPPAPPPAPPKPPRAPRTPRAATPTRQPYQDQPDLPAVEKAMAARYKGTHFDFAGLSLDTANKIARHLDALATEFPLAMSNLKYIGTNQSVPRNLRSFMADFTSDNTYAHVSRSAYTPKPESMSLNTKYFSDPAGFARAIARDTRSGWHPAQADPSDWLSVLTHEFGHVVDFWTRSDNTSMITQTMRYSGFGTVNTTAQAWREGSTTMKRPTSQYAKTNEYETFAEAFAASYHGTDQVKASPAVQQMTALRKALTRAYTPKGGMKNVKVPGDIADEAARQRALEEHVQLAKDLGIELW